MTEFLSIEKNNISMWRDKILSASEYNREDIYDSLKDCKFNIKTTAKRLEEFYILKISCTN